jgi:phosphopantetheinyl transferase (holo-ACP synthase)
MIGNDVVDLKDRESQAQQLHPRFDRRVFSDHELAQLTQSSAPHTLRWSLWAAKEASYKLGRKHNSELGFSPRLFQCSGLDGHKLLVHHPAINCRVQISVDENHVHAVSTIADQDACDHGPASKSHTPTSGSPIRVVIRQELSRNEECTHSPSQKIRELACRCLALYLQRPAHQLTIQTRNKIPYLTDRYGDILGDLSLSHHGRYMAIAFLRWCPEQLPPARTFL